MSQCFLKPYEIIGGGISVKVDLCNYATKADLKNATGIDTSKLANKKEFRRKKLIKKKGNKLYVKWKENDNLFNN